MRTINGRPMKYMADQFQLEFNERHYSMEWFRGCELFRNIYQFHLWACLNTLCFDSIAMNHTHLNTLPREPHPVGRVQMNEFRQVEKNIRQQKGRKYVESYSMESVYGSQVTICIYLSIYLCGSEDAMVKLNSKKLNKNNY